MFENRLLPIVVLDEEDHAEPLAEALLAGGLDVVEITLRTPAALPGLGRADISGQMHADGRFAFNGNGDLAPLGFPIAGAAVAVGGSLTSKTVTETAPVAVPPWPSLTVKAKLSVPLKFATGV